ncbi:hypothetical protein GCM10011533_34740 [Streptosporangium jomthongense]|nr:hypothetical protein GCM10011533_34740 [Streptosporangium jomthongense]
MEIRRSETGKSNKNVSCQLAEFKSGGLRKHMCFRYGGYKAFALEDLLFDRIRTNNWWTQEANINITACKAIYLL